MKAELRARLITVLDAAEAASSGYRRSVAAYLFDAGLGRLWMALNDADEADDALVLSVWQLMLDTVSSRRFGVSDSAWRTGDYPDRYFPVLWLDIVPAALARVPAKDRGSWLARLFNLGENLPPAVRPAANQLAALLSTRIDALVADLEATLRAAMVEVGLLASPRVAPMAWTRVEWFEGLDLSVVDGLVVGDVACVGGGFVVRDSEGVARLGVQLAGEALVVGDVPEGEPEPSLVQLVGRMLTGPGGPVGPVQGVAPVVAVLESGDGVVVDAASLWIHRVRACGP